MRTPPPLPGDDNNNNNRNTVGKKKPIPTEGHLLRAKHCAKYCIYVILFNPHPL